MAGALGVVLTGATVSVEGSHAIPVYVDDSLPIVGPARACVIADGVSIPFGGGPPLAVRLAPVGTPAIGPAIPVYVIPGGGSLSGGASAPFTPSSIAGLQFWHKSTAIPPVLDGVPIATWADSSGNSQDATQGTGALQPIYKTNQINTTVPSVRFDGTNDRMTTPSITHNIGTGDFTLFALGRTRGALAYRAILTTGVGGAPGLYFHSGKINFYWAADHVYTTALVINTWYFVIIERSGTTISLYINGVTDATTFNLATSMANGAWYLGNEDTGTAASLDGDLVETGLYNIGLSAGQRTQLNTYISTTYAIF